MERIGNQQDGIHPAGLGDVVNRAQALERCRSLILLEDAICGQPSFLDQIDFAGLCFGEAISRLLSTGDHDDAGNIGVEEVSRLVEASLEHRRGPSVVLGGPQHDDGVRGPDFVDVRLLPDLEREESRVSEDEENHHQDDPANDPHDLSSCRCRR